MVSVMGVSISSRLGCDFGDWFGALGSIVGGSIGAARIWVSSGIEGVGMRPRMGWPAGAHRAAGGELGVHAS